MKELNEIINDYLQAKNTDYALMINGDWGCGKTYYLNHSFKDFVSNLSCPPKEGVVTNVEKYTPAYISLYGISTPEDFQYRVFMGVNKWANNKLAKVAATMGTKVAGFFGINIDKDDINNLWDISNKTVLVFDDLERISSDKISVKEVLGLINEYSEHNHYKVIVVCNESIFEGEGKGKNKHEEYWRYKEKTIRYTYHFEADITSVYDTIANTFENQSYKQYLETNKEYILKMFRLGGKKNLRTLKFYLDSMSKIYQHTTYTKVANQESILRTLFITTMIYAAEYKNGRGKDKLIELKATYEIDLDYSFHDFHKENDNEREPSYPEEVANIYKSFYHDEMAQLPFIIDYLITGYLNQQTLKKWVVDRNKDIDNAKDKPELILFRELSSFSTIDDDALSGKLNQIIMYANDGVFKVYDLMQVYALLVKYHYFGFNNFSLTDEIELTFKKAIDQFEKEWKYIPQLEYKIPMWDNSEKNTESYKKYNAIKHYLLQMNDRSRQKANEVECNRFLFLAESGNIDGIKHYRETDNRISLGGIDWERVCKVLEKGSNPIACEVATCLQFLIADSSCIHSEDFERLKEGLQKWLDDYSKKEDKRVRNIYILQLKKHIDSIIKSYQATSSN